MRRCQGPGCDVEFVPAAPHQKFHSPGCRVAAHRASGGPERGGEAPERVTRPRDDFAPRKRSVTRSLPLFTIPEDWPTSGTSDGAESRRVLEYVNTEIARWNAGERHEPLDLILDAARERLRRQ